MSATTEYLDALTDYLDAKTKHAEGEVADGDFSDVTRRVEEKLKRVISETVNDSLRGH